MNSPVNIMWFRQDLRLDDNPALTAASASGDPVVPLFILSEKDGDDPWAPGENSLRQQQSSLANLAAALERLGSRLVVREGQPDAVLAEIANEVRINGVYWNRRYEPHERAREEALRAWLGTAGIDMQAYDGNVLFAPGQILTSSGKPYRVFTPFWKACLERHASDPPPLKVAKPPAPASWPKSCNGSIAPKAQSFDLGERIERFLIRYADLRDRPDIDGTSQLSTRLHFGQLSPRRLWHAVDQYATEDPSAREAPAKAFLRQLVWREFAFHLLYHFPDTTDSPMRPEFERFPWNDDSDGLQRWKLGQTGYPMVDAGMRQLAATGWMHNRVRLVVASFLVKHLLIDWRLGARHFWETLDDADLANNTLGWQWVAGSGADAAPYFRIFNPVLQGEKFDPEGRYTRKWVPEIAGLPDRWIHKPWMAPDSMLADAGVDLGKSYPHPIVDHAFARQRALAAYDRIKKS